MELLEEIDFLIQANKKHEESDKTDDFIRSVEKLHLRGSISVEALKMARKLFPAKNEIVKEAKRQLLSKEKDEDNYGYGDPCGSGRGYSRSSC